VELEKDGWKHVDMFLCQDVKNIGLSNHKLSPLLSAPYDHNARLSQADGRTNIMVITGRFVLRMHRAIKTIAWIATVYSLRKCLL